MSLASNLSRVKSWANGAVMRILGLPHEQIEQQPAEEHDADGDGEQPAGAAGG